MNYTTIAIALALLFHQSYAQEVHTHSAAKQPTLLLLDTAGHDRYHYRNIQLLAQSVGFVVDYRNLYGLLENDTITGYDAVFLMVSLDLLKNSHTVLAQKCIQAVRKLSHNRGVMVGVLLPGLPQANEALYQASSTVLAQIGIGNGLRWKEQLKAILKSDLHVGELYGTTLVNVREKRQSSSENGCLAGENQSKNTMLALPLCKNFSVRAQKTLPIGIYSADKTMNNHYFVGALSAFSFADIAENFFRNPLLLEDRTELLLIAQQVLRELYEAFMHGGMPHTLSCARTELPDQLKTSFIVQEKKKYEAVMAQAITHNPEYKWIAQEGIACAWEAPDDYFLYDDSTIAALNPEKAAALKAQALDDGISFLYDAAINLVWFEFNAEAYLSDHARFKKDTERFIKQVQAIAHKLKETAKRLNKPMPHVFIGTDITTNFATHPVHHQVQDLFGRTYTKIPSPLDIETLWKPEVLEPFDLFCKTLSAQLPITGIFLDFEMYHAQDQAGGYTDLMDFSDDSWHHCCHMLGDGSSCSLGSVAQRVEYLMTHRLFTQYFSCLEHEAVMIGKMLKEHVRSLIPDILIAVYLPTLSTSWFYRGILQGLGSPEQPLIAATFNTDFYSHARWLHDHNIFLIHGTPLLLSKLSQEKDFDLIDRCKQYHDFVWYNRPSRMVYANKKGKWWSTEASSLDAKTVSQGIRARKQRRARS